MRGCFELKRFLILLIAFFSVGCVANADNLELPDELVEIEAEAFYGATNIEIVNLPFGVKSIGSKAFSNSSLKQINLPDSLSYIANDALDEGVSVSANPGTYAFDWAVSNWFIDPPQEPGQLDYPRIVMDDLFEGGQDVTFNIVKDSKVEDYYFNLYKNGKHIYQDFYFGNTGTYTIHGYDLQPGYYVLAVTAVADNYTENTATKQFHISGRRPAAPVVTVDKTVVAEGENFTFTVEIEDADKILARQYSYGMYSDDIVDAESGTVSVTYPYMNRKSSYRFAALIDGRWSDFSGEITIAPKTESGLFNNILEKPVIHINDSYESGKDVAFTVDHDPDAEDYFFNLYREETQIYWDFHFWEPFSNTFNGYDLQPGTYKLVVTALAEDYDPVSATAFFTITGNKRPAPYVTVDKVEVEENETYTFTVNTVGVEKVLAREYFQGGYCEETKDVESYTMSFTYSNIERAKRYQFCTCVNGYWSDFSETITVYPRK